MNKANILQKAIQKAIDNHWDIFGLAGSQLRWDVAKEDHTYKLHLHKRIDEQTMWNLSFCLHNIIFNHDFAKAFWGSGDVLIEAENYTEYLSGIYQGPHTKTARLRRKIPAWQYHLQQMVLCEDPIEYLAKFI